MHKNSVHDAPSFPRPDPGRNRPGCRKPDTRSPPFPFWGGRTPTLLPEAPKAPPAGPTGDLSGFRSRTIVKRVIMLANLRQDLCSTNVGSALRDFPARNRGGRHGDALPVKGGTAFHEKRLELAYEVNHFLPETHGAENHSKTRASGCKPY